ncbi:hypothetical protein LCGC14_1831320 [marine sediment metagenome]|uniref:Uncharacterized protein n=1 Tax=marine sediment metagenome TaxID=412755 RepID=A0A0F9GG32_9ZZZZ
MMYMKQSTASQTVLLGPYIDDTDGKTAETGLTIANTDIRLSKNGGNMAAKNSGGGTHDEAGWYAVTFDATDSATVGRLQVSSDVAGALPVWAEFQVVEEDTYTWLFASGAAPDTQVAAIKSTVDNVESGVGIIIQDTNELQTDWANGGRLDLLLDATKAKTDQMVFTKANELDANTKSINDAEVVGDGNATPWDGV